MSLGSVYWAFQKHLLPKPLCRMVARLYFYPTLPISLSSRMSNLMSRMDGTPPPPQHTRMICVCEIDGIWVGVAPTGLGVGVKDLTSNKIGAVVNLCDEYGGPVRSYAKHNIQQLYLPTVVRASSLSWLCVAILSPCILHQYCLSLCICRTTSSRASRT